jgi:hypothetical protein
MSESPLNKLKNGALQCASALLLRVDIVAEESRLNDKYRMLGEKVLDFIKNDSLDTVKEDPSIVELIGAIHENEVRIQELKKRSSKECSCSSEKD